MALRKFPYGYSMLNGEIRICESEAAIIRDIFKRRTNGESNYQMAKMLLESKSDYFSDSIHKNSCKISIILYDRRYIGADNFPPIISVEIFDKVQTMKGKAYCNKKIRSKNKGIMNTYFTPTTAMLIPNVAVFEKEELFKSLLKSGNPVQIRNAIFDLAAEKYKCIELKGE